MIRITDEAVRAAAKAWTDAYYSDDGGWMRAALEAALPHLEEATPVASRERLAEVIDPAAFDQTKKRSKQPAAVIQWAARQHMAFVAADRLIAAGVFREGATPAIDREAIVAALAGKPILRSGDKPEGWRGSLTEEECFDVADVLLALIGGAS